MFRTSTIELYEADMKFSAAHITIFSKNSRSNLHGHNFNVYASLKTLVKEDEGMTFDHRLYKSKICKLCENLEETVILPSRSKYLSVIEKDQSYHVSFDFENMVLQKRDVKLLPISNVTVEELSNWFLQQIIIDHEEIEKYNIQEITIKILSGSGQSGSATWKNINELC